MKRAEIKEILDKLYKDIDSIVDERTASVQKTLFNLVEVLAEHNSALQEEIQKLKDEINRLKGEQGKPDIRKQKKGDGNADHSSEDDRRKRRKNKSRKPKNKKKGTVKIDRKVTCEIDKDSLPDDAQFKGYETRVFQDLKIITDNVEFILPTYYSPSLKQTFIAPLPIGYHGEFGPGIRSLVITLYRDSGMTEPAIERFLTTFDIQISNSTISRMITENHDTFHQEKEDIINAGLKATPYQHIDDTGSRVNGKNHYTHVLCNPYFTAFFTRPKKDRLTLLDIICCGELKYELNSDSYDLMTELGLSNKRLLELKETSCNKVMTSDEIEVLLKKLFPNPKKHSTSRRIIREASAIVYYQNTECAIEYLICDDAPQFNKITTHKALCWIHEGRHYKKFNPILDQHQKVLDDFNEQFWDYYQALLSYQENPSKAIAQQLSEEFDLVFSTSTGYEALDKRIAMTLSKKEYLLLVLIFPFLPLENNTAELGARVQARIRDINLQTISDNGTKTKDTFATIVQTARKLGVNIYHYIYDRVSGTCNMPSLADLIYEKSNPIPDTS